MSDKKAVFKTIRNSAVIKNPLLFEAIGLCPLVAIATSLNSALFLALVTAVEMVVCEVLTALLLKNVRRYWRVLLYVIFGVAIIFPITYITNRFLPQMSMNFGVYLPIMAVNSLIALHCERVAVKRSVKDSFIDALSASISYGVVAILTGVIREILANGTIAGLQLNLPVKFSGLAMPFGALIILGFMAAVLKAVISKKYPEANPDKAFDTSEIRRSLRGTLRELMNDEFNPYGEEAETESAFVRIKNEKSKKEKPKKDRPKKEKPEKEAHKKEKKPKITADEAPRRATHTENDGGRTYLDDFSDMLSELEDYKSRNDDAENIDSSENNDGGDAE